MPHAADRSAGAPRYGNYARAFVSQRCLRRAQPRVSAATERAFRYADITASAVFFFRYAMHGRYATYVDIYARDAAPTIVSRYRCFAGADRFLPGAVKRQWQSRYALRRYTCTGRPEDLLCYVTARPDSAIAFTPQHAFVLSAAVILSLASPESLFVEAAAAVSLHCHAARRNTRA